MDNLKPVYNFDTKSFKKTQTVDYAVGFTAVANNQAQVNVCYTTDGSVASQNFIFLQDDKHGFPEFNPAPIVRDDTLQKAPGIKTALNPLAPLLTTQVSQQLQAEVGRIHATDYRQWYEAWPAAVRTQLREAWGEPPGTVYRHNGAIAIAGLFRRIGAIRLPGTVCCTAPLRRKSQAIAIAGSTPETIRSANWRPTCSGTP